MNRKELLQVANPILFNTEMVRAILENRKTVTRRIAKKVYLYSEEDREFTTLVNGEFTGPLLEEQVIDLKAPYKPGDTLYIRETWCQVKDIPHWYQYYRSNGTHEISPYEYVYRADNLEPHEGILPEIKWHPSIHMTKEAARIFLKVTGVRLERLQEITEEQAQAEGCNSGLLTGACTARGQFEHLWNSTIKKADLDAYGWEANHCVWVIEFEKMEVKL